MRGSFALIAATTSAVPSGEPSSTTIASARGEAAITAARVARMLSRSWYVGRTTRQRCELSAEVTGGSLRRRGWWNPASNQLHVTIYLDNAATTPLRAEALDAMLPFLRGVYANPS